VKSVYSDHHTSMTVPVTTIGVSALNPNVLLTYKLTINKVVIH